MRCNMWYKCPACKNKVDFETQIGYVFDEYGEADFEPLAGLYMHTIVCEGCGAYWVVSVSGMCIDKVEEENGDEYRERIEKMKLLMKNHKPAQMRNSENE